MNFSKFRFFGSEGSILGRTGIQSQRFARFLRFLVCGTLDRASEEVFVDFSIFRFFGSEGSKMVDLGRIGRPTALYVGLLDFP